MKERSIIFKSEMVKAILEGRKTQTRRVIKETLNISGTCEGIYFCKDTERWYWQLLDKPNVVDICIGKCRYGKIRDRLYVKESLRKKTNFTAPHYITYMADCSPVVTENPYSGLKVRPYWTWKRNILPAMFMPKLASRITLEITDIRVERVQEISIADVEREGFIYSGNLKPKDNLTEFTKFWDSTHKEPYRWEDNPWVWVISFRRVK